MQILTGHKARVAALEENLRARRDGTDGEDGTTEIVVQTDDAAVNALKQELATLKAQALKPDNDSKAIPLAIGRIGEELQSFRQQLADMLERLHNLEQRPTDITPSDVSQDDVQLLAQATSETGAAVAGLLQMLAVIDKRLDALEARVSSIPRAMLEEYMTSLREIQSRSA